MIFEICESARSIKSKPSKPISVEDSIDKLRTEIDVLREKIFDQNIPNISESSIFFKFFALLEKNVHINFCSNRLMNFLLVVNQFIFVF